MRSVSILLSAGFIFFSGCKQHEEVAGKPKLTVDMKLIDSISKHSDSTYEKPYKRSDFVTATYYISSSDSAITQVMKDSAGTIRQVTIEKNKRRIYTADFYANGQSMHSNKLDDYGQYNGEAQEFYDNGNLKRSGSYKGGLHIGQWKNYDEHGKYVSTDDYNADGQQVNP